MLLYGGEGGVVDAMGEQNRENVVLGGSPKCPGKNHCFIFI